MDRREIDYVICLQNGLHWRKEKHKYEVKKQFLGYLLDILYFEDGSKMTFLLYQFVL